MMHLLRKYDVARFTRNDAMFAIMCRQTHIIRRSRHHWQSQHHLPKANIIQKIKARLANICGVLFTVLTYIYAPSSRSLSKPQATSLRLDLFAKARYNKRTENPEFAEKIATVSCLSTSVTRDII